VRRFQWTTLEVAVDPFKLIHNGHFAVVHALLGARFGHPGDVRRDLVA